MREEGTSRMPRELEHISFFFFFLERAASATLECAMLAYSWFKARIRHG